MEQLAQLLELRVVDDDARNCGERIVELRQLLVVASDLREHVERFAGHHSAGLELSSGRVEQRREVTHLVASTEPGDEAADAGGDQPFLCTRHGGLVRAVVDELLTERESALLPRAVRILLAAGTVDLGNSIDGLPAIVRTGWGENVFAGHLFVFVSRRRDRVKVLTWYSGGLIAFYRAMSQFRELERLSAVGWVREVVEVHVEVDRDSVLVPLVVS